MRKVTKRFFNIFRYDSLKEIGWGGLRGLSLLLANYSLETLISSAARKCILVGNYYVYSLSPPFQ